MVWLYLALAVIAGAAVFHFRTQAKYRKYVRGEEPHTVSVLIDMPFEEHQRFRPDYNNFKLPGALVRTEKLDAETTRLRIYQEHEIEGAKPIDIVYDTVLRKIGGTDDVPIQRMLEENGKPFPRGEDHYFTEMATPHGESQTMAIYEERGVFRSTAYFLGVIRGAKRGLEHGGKQAIDAWKADNAANGTD